MNDQETKNIVEAMEQWKKMHEITADDIREYIRIPRFSKSKKEKIFDIVRKIGIKNSKAEIEFLFTDKEHKKKYKESRYITISTIMMEISAENGTKGHTLYEEFQNIFSLFTVREIANCNTMFAFEKCFETAYATVGVEIQGYICHEWLTKRISLTEWKKFLMSIAK